MSDDLPEGDWDCRDGNHGPPPCPGDLTGPLVDFEEIEAAAALDDHDPALVEAVARATNTDPAVVRAVLTLLQAKGVLATASPAFTNHGDRVTVEWPAGRGPTVIAPEMVDEWVATQNEVRRLRRRFCPKGHYLNGISAGVTGRCWKCERDARREACDHDGPRDARWAGILGWRYSCGRCGASMPDPDDAPDGPGGTTP